MVRNTSPDLIPGWFHCWVAPCHLLKEPKPGRVLAKLGDPRKEVLDVSSMLFCLVPKGAFIFGEDEDKKSIDLPDYWIGKYPVTNAQFR